MPNKQPPSDKQLAANRANARKSTGPRTPEGKSRAAQNARKHSFSGADFHIIKLEEKDAIDRLRDDLIAAYAPQNSQELFTLERIALAQHNLLRMARFEAGLFMTALNRSVFDIETLSAYTPLHEELRCDYEDVQAQNRAYVLAQGFHTVVRESDRTWTLFLRYQAQAERLYRRAVEEFERLRKLRPQLANVFPNEAISPPEPNHEPDAVKSENHEAAPLAPARSDAPLRAEHRLDQLRPHARRDSLQPARADQRLERRQTQARLELRRRHRRRHAGSHAARLEPHALQHHQLEHRLRRRRRHG